MVPSYFYPKLISQSRNMSDSLFRILKCYTEYITTAYYVFRVLGDTIHDNATNGHPA